MSNKNANRAKRAAIAQETLQILKTGCYLNDLGKTVDVSKDLSLSLEGALWYNPAELETLLNKLPSEFEPQKTTFEVLNCTTFAAARAQIALGEEKVLALNFASAKNPGGGFLGGSQAQEECLARASGLVPTLEKHMDLYLKNRLKKNCLYSNDMIYSPQVPVFRDDEDNLLADYYKLSIITSAAVNAGCVRKNQPKSSAQIAPTMLDRMAKILAIAATQDYDVLILGAWGCGVFRNEPSEIALQFKKQLAENILFKNRFKKVIFGVLDSSKEMSTFNAFERVFRNC